MTEEEIERLRNLPDSHQKLIDFYVKMHSILREGEVGPVETTIYATDWEQIEEAIEAIEQELFPE